MVKNFQKKKFTTYSALEKYFTQKILPQKNKSSKVIGKTLFVWDKKPKEQSMGKTYQVISMTDLEKVQMLMKMGLDQQTAIEAVAMEKDMPPVDPRQFSGQQSAPQQMPQPMPQQPQQMANPGMGSLSGVPSGMERPMAMPTPRPEDLMMRQMQDGRDRTFNPRDAINSYNAPNT